MPPVRGINDERKPLGAQAAAGHCQQRDEQYDECFRS